MERRSNTVIINFCQQAIFKRCLIISGRLAINLRMTATAPTRAPPLPIPTTIMVERISAIPLLNSDVRLMSAELIWFQFLMEPSHPMSRMIAEAWLCPNLPEAQLWGDETNKNPSDAEATADLVAVVAVVAATALVLLADCKPFNHPIENDSLDLCVSNQLQM
mgnify:FL=1